MQLHSSFGVCSNIIFINNCYLIHRSICIWNKQWHNTSYKENLLHTVLKAMLFGRALHAKVGSGGGDKAVLCDPKVCSRHQGKLTMVLGSLPGNWCLCMVLQSLTLWKPCSLQQCNVASGLVTIVVLQLCCVWVLIYRTVSNNCHI